jgi:hypothetical protein
MDLGRVRHPSVVRAFSDPDWCNLLENAAADAVTGKVLSVCAAYGIASEVVRVRNDPAGSEALVLLAEWIDDPTDERFDRICRSIFGEGELDEVVWWSLRTATSSIGNYEAGWALEATSKVAEKAGWQPEVVHGSPRKR